MPDLKPKKKATRAQLLQWLAFALPHVPKNLVKFSTGKRPQWMLDAEAELKSEGFVWVSPKK